MAQALDRDKLLEAFDDIGAAAIRAGERLSIAVYGGSALLLASNFRFSTEDVDIAALGEEWPDWLSASVEQISAARGWSPTWFNDAVSSFLSPLANSERDLRLFGTFPRGDAGVGLTVFVPTPQYLLALKLAALRVSDFNKGARDMADVAGLLRVLDVREIEQAIAIMAEFFPRSAADADKQRFVLKWIMSAKGPDDATYEPGRGV